MKLVKLSELSEKERKKVLQKQQERINNNTKKANQEKQRVNFNQTQIAHDDFVERRQHISNIVNDMNNRRNVSSLWDKIKNIAENSALGAKGGALGSLQYTKNIADNKLNNAQQVRDNRVSSSSELNNDEKKLYFSQQNYIKNANARQISNQKITQNNLLGMATTKQLENIKKRNN